ncbi:Cerato-platanin [Trametopsis cervina]|nr:Cerato-platanin [Trametopsis cervina]
MKFFAVLAALAVSALAAPASDAAAASTPVSVSFDTVYDNSGQSLATVTCSDGSNGLLTKGFTTFGSLPGFANIGGAGAVEAFNSANCGSCWQLTFNGTSINVLAIDHAAAGTFNIALSAMNKLTHNQATFLGRVNAQATQVASSACGL